MIRIARTDPFFFRLAFVHLRDLHFFFFFLTDTFFLRCLYDRDVCRQGSRQGECQLVSRQPQHVGQTFHVELNFPEVCSYSFGDDSTLVYDYTVPVVPSAKFQNLYALHRVPAI